MLKKKERYRSVVLIAVLVLGSFHSFLIVPISADGENWHDTNFDYRKLITVNSSLIDETLTNFPILVHTSSDSNLTSHAQSDGDDIYFVLYSDNSTVLNHEIERYASGTLNAWVNITSLSSSADTKLWMYYGNSTCSSQENVTGVWDSDYLAVYHGEMDGSDNLIDSTYGHNATETGSITETTSGNMVGYAFNVDDGEYFTPSNNDDFDFGTDDFTLELWFYPVSPPQVGGYHSWLGGYSSSNGLYYGYYYNSGYSTPMFKCGDGVSYSTAWDSESGVRNDLFMNGWMYYYVVKTSDTLSSYYNKTLDASVGYSNAEIIPPEPFTIGHEPTGEIDGSFDEVRISLCERSNSWMNATYDTMNDNGNFIDIGSEEQYSTGSTNSAPTISGVKPVDDASEVGLIPRLFAVVSDSDGDSINVTWHTNVTGSWTQFASENNIVSGTNITARNMSMNQTSTEYWWSLNVTDGTNWTNQTFSFTSQTGNFSIKWENNYFTSALESYSNWVSEDIDGDGVHELFYGGADTAISRCCVHCFNGSTGEVIWRYNLSSSYGITTERHIPLAVEDLDNDGDFEVVVAAGSYTVALHAENGAEFWAVPAASGWHVPAVVDIDGSGYPYVYVTSRSEFESTVRVKQLYGSNGTVKNSHTITGCCYGGVSVADLDRDGDYEIVVTSGSGGSCFTSDLDLLWSTDLIQSSSHCAALINVTGDADLEVVVLDQATYLSGPDGLYIYYADGTRWRGDSSIWSEDACHTQPAVYDIDGDGHVEVIPGNGGSKTYVFDVVDWDNDTTLKCDGMYEERTSEPPDFANVLGDSDLEIVSGAAYMDGTFEIYNSTYDVVDEIGEDAPASANQYGMNFFVQDVDNDGLNEIVLYGTRDSNVTCFDTLAVASDPGVRTDTTHYSERRLATGAYVPKIGAKISLSSPSQTDEATDVSSSITELTIDMNEPDGDLIEWSIETSPDIGSDSGSGESNGTKSCSVSGLNAGTTYTWFINASDGVNWKIVNYTFTTAGSAYDGPSWYVNGSSGSDSNNGSLNYPFKTIQKAVDSVNAGDTIYVMAGTYTEVVDFNGTERGTNENWITLRPYQSDSVVLDGTGVTGQGEHIISLRGAAYTRLTGFEIRNSGCYGVYVDEPSQGVCNLTFDNLTIHNCSASAIMVYPYDGAYGLIEDIIIENNTIYDCHNKCNYETEPPNEVVTVSNVSGFIIKDNYFYLNNKITIDAKNCVSHGEIYDNRINTTYGVANPWGNSGIYVDGYDDHAHNISIYRNHLWGNGTMITIGTEQGGTVRDVDIINNICEGAGHCFQMNNHTSSYNPSSSEHKKTNILVCNNNFLSTTIAYQHTDANGTLVNFTFRNNILDGETGINIGSGQTNFSYQNVDHNLFNVSASSYWGNDSINGTFGFVDAAGGDFNLTGSSDAIDNGSSIYAPSVDYFGSLRPKGLRIDIGAIESSFTSGSEPSDDEGDDRPSFPYNGDHYWDDPIVDDEGDDWDIDSSLSLFDFSKWTIDDEAMQFPGVEMSNEQIFFLVVGVVCLIVLLIGLLKIV